MGYGTTDRVPRFEEGIREEVIDAWRAQGLPAGAVPSDLFPTDPRVEIAPDLSPRPSLEAWPASCGELGELRRRLDPGDEGRLPGDWGERVAGWRTSDQVRVLRVHQGLFLSMGVHDWSRFHELALMFSDKPELVRRTMAIHGELAAGLAERVLRDIDVDAAVFSEPIGGNDGPLLSPRMYQDLVLASYRPALDVLARHGVKTVIFRTYANARALLPRVLEAGFNCLWGCDVSSRAMGYRNIRREYGRRLRLIGGIDHAVLLRGKADIRREMEEVVPPLLANGGYVPLTSGRVREDVPFENYVYYREVLEALTRTGRAGVAHARGDQGAT